MAKRKKQSGKGGNTQAAVNQANAEQAASNGAAPQAATATAAAATTPAASPQAAAATISRKEMLRMRAEQKRRQQNMWLAIGGAVIVVLIGVAIYMSYLNSLPVVGETTYPTQGNLHIPLGTTPSSPYNSTPPTTGPHYENLAAWGVQRTPVRYEHLVHNLEDAGVVVYYQCPDGCPEMVAELEAILQPLIDNGRHIVLAPNDPNWVMNGQAMHKDMGAPIALTAWRKLLLMDEVNAETIMTFIERYEGIDHHRG